jgi:serine phosphatase RsbU (regulator of sigma subunit)
MIVSKLSIRKQLILLISIVVFVALLFASVLIYTYSYRNYRQQLVEEMLSVAQLIGVNNQAALAFDTPQDTKEQLGKLSENKEIKVASILTPKRKVFANYVSGERPQWIIIPGKLDKEYRFNKGFLEIVKDIYFDGEKIATVYLKVSLDTTKKQIKTLIEMLILIVVFSYLFSLAAIYIISGLITNPILNLAKVTSKISANKDYSLRVNKIKQPTEIGILYNGFNDMLNVIEQQNNEILIALKEISEQKNKIEIQKNRIEEQSLILKQWNKDITASISYAKNIQNNILVPINKIREIHRSVFVLFEPRDIVSGDFYWFHKQNEYHFFCAADSTGHGVPGAMISVIGFNLINQIVKAKKIIQPHLILNELDNEIKSFFQKSDGKYTSDDGMDISFCSYNTKTNELHYAGANNSALIVRNKEIIELKADKHPLGSGSIELIGSFTLHTLKMQPGDNIYLFSDGYADQFGGPRGKKFMKRQFKEMLIEISPKTSNDQHIEMYERLNRWKGDLEQVDDIVVIGIKL